MTQTNNLKINLVAQSQAQKEVTINEAISRLEATLNRGAETILSSPPLSPVEGTCYLIGANATGAWVGKERNIGYFNNGWKFIAPNEGVTIWLKDVNKQYIFTGSSWTDYVNLMTPATLGINGSASTTDRLSVTTENAIFKADGGGNVTLKVSKTATANKACQVFSTNFSGRAEIGLINDDDLRISVSGDGSTWNPALLITKTTGAVAIGPGATAVKKIVSGIYALDFPSIAANASADLVVTLTGVLAGNATSLQMGFPAVQTTGLSYLAWASANDSVTVRCFNLTAAAINPAAQSVRLTATVF